MVVWYACGGHVRVFCYSMSWQKTFGKPKSFPIFAAFRKKSKGFSFDFLIYTGIVQW